MTFTPDPGVPGLPDLFTTDGTVLLGAAVDLDDVRVSAEILRVARDPKLGHHVLSLTTAHTPKGDRFGALAGSLFARDLGSVVWTVTRGDVGLTRLACTATIPEIAL